MLGKVKSVMIMAGLITTGLLVYPQDAHAWVWGIDRDRDHRVHREVVYRHYPTYGTIAVGLPHGFISLSLGRSRYFYYDGTYYRRAHRGYIIVQPPIGAVVETIPDFYQTQIINGQTYYFSDGIYYRYGSRGFVVVEQPGAVLVSAPAVVAAPAPVVQAAPVVSGNSFTVNIPNASGSYTPVVIQRSGNGFVGPQGEFYAQFPTVDQLKVMYGK